MLMHLHSRQSPFMQKLKVSLQGRYGQGTGGELSR